MNEPLFAPLHPPGRPRGERNPDLTRRAILEAAFNEIYRNGFQGTRLDNILRATDLTKGALYHHFPNKQALGYAVVDEVIHGFIESLWLEPLRNARDPLAKLVDTIRHVCDLVGEQLITLGCPLNNLAQEMSPLDEGFRERIDRVYRAWHDGIVEALETARRQGRLREDVDTDQAATFILASLSGCVGMAKNAQSGLQLKRCNQGLIDYIQTLRKQD